MIISERIFGMLKERGMSQKEFSIKTGIAQSTISDWKTKKTNPASDKIMVICDTLEVSPYELLTGTEGGGAKKVEYVIVDKTSQDYMVLETYRNLNEDKKNRFVEYVKALGLSGNRQFLPGKGMALVSHTLP